MKLCKCFWFSKGENILFLLNEQRYHKITTKRDYLSLSFDFFHTRCSLFQWFYHPVKYLLLITRILVFFRWKWSRLVSSLQQLGVLRVYVQLLHRGKTHFPFLLHHESCGQQDVWYSWRDQESKPNQIGAWSSCQPILCYRRRWSNQNSTLEKWFIPVTFY